MSDSNVVQMTLPSQPEELTELQKNALKKALGLLKAMGAKYCVIAPNGSEYGELKAIQPSTKKRARHLYEQQMMQVPPGGYAQISPEGEDVSWLASIVAAWASAHWGPGTFTTHANLSTGMVEVLRAEEVDV